MINPDLSFDEYRAIEAINASAIKKGQISMLHMRQEITRESTPPTPAMQWGSVIHLKVLEPELFKIDVGEWDGSKKTKAFKEHKEEWPQVKYWLTSAQLDALEQINENIYNHPEMAMILGDSEKEVSMFWEGKYGKAKARLDALSVAGANIADLKSTTIIEPAKFQTHAWKMGYMISAGWYVEACESHGIMAPSFYLIVVEARPPYDTVLYEMDSSLIEMGREEAVKIATLYKCCLGTYKGVAPYGITGLTAPEWALSKPELDFEEEKK